MTRFALPLVGGLTTLSTLLAISPVLTNGSWLTAPLVAIAAVVLSGMVLRTLKVPQTYCSLAQLLIGLVALLAFVVPQHMLFSVIPTPGALSALADLIVEGASTARGGVPPIAPTLGTAALLATLTFPIAVIVDDCATSGRAAIAGLPLLTLFAVCAAVVRQPIGVLLLILPLIGYALMLWMEEAASRTHRGRPRAMLAAVLAGAVVAGAAVGAATATSQRIALPDGGIFATGGDHIRTPSDTVARTTDLAGQLSLQDPIALFRVTTNDPSPYYLRALVLEDWDRDGWSFISPEPSFADRTDLPVPDAPGAVMASESTVEVLGYTDRFAPGYYATRSISIDGFSYDADQQVLFAPRKNPFVDDDTYQITSEVPRPTAAELSVATSEGLSPESEARNLQAPTVDPAVEELTAQVTAGTATPYEAAIAIDAFFNDPASGFIYTLEVPDPGQLDPLASFLQQRQGFCEQYASAMTSMLRLADVPARVVVGYTKGTPVEEGVYEVTTSDAHAWVEAWFSGVGWVSFDPTPIGDRAVPLPYVPRYQVPEQTDPADAGSEEIPDATTTPAAPVAQPDAAGGAGEGGLPTVLARIGQALLALVALLALAGIPAALRHRRWLRRRADASRPGTGAAAAAWAELTELATDLGAVTDRRHSPVRCARSWADQLQVPDRSALERVAHQAQVAAYADRTRQDELPALDDALVSARAALLGSVEKAARWRAILLPSATGRTTGRIAGRKNSASAATG